MNDPNLVFLIADRDMVLRRMLTGLLQDMGFTNIHATPSGTMAWTLIKQHGADFIITGMHLQEISGLSLLKIVRADSQFSDTPYLILAEVVTQSEVLAAGESGVSEVLCRPLNPERIRDKIQELLSPDRDPQTQIAERHFKNGLRFMEEERWDEALASFRLVLGSFKSAEVYYNLGYINTVLENYEEAIAYFRKATEIDHTFAKAYQKMAECYKALGKGGKADACLNRAVELYMTREQEGASRDEILAEVVAVNPDTINIYNTMGILYRRQGKYHEAAQQYIKALRVHPDDEHIYYNLSRCLLDSGDRAGAIDAIKNSLRLNPKFKEAAQLLQIMVRGNAGQKPAPSAS